MSSPHRNSPYEVPTGFHTAQPPQGAAERRLAVLGSPIEHSRSPQLHLAAYQQLGLDWEYSRWEIPKGGLRDALRSRGQGWGGFSVTAPHKAEALEFVREASPDAIKSGAVNTIVFDSLDAQSGAIGENTDIPGALDAFAERGITSLRGRVDVLGSGGTASSLGIAAQRLGAEEVRIWGRRPEAAAALAGQLGDGATSGDLAQWELTAGVSAVIDTVPGGFAAEGIEIEPGRIPGVALFSAAYSPWPTPLASHWLAVEGRIVTGLDLLLHQAVRQVRLFTGLGVDQPLPDEAAVIAAMRASLSQGS
ncbi:shikimate dehydrogenase family protein [Gulosibacter chungangensis]|uniref:Shikimate dehydrogenase n=1 Tax=Gulosibacter chungangensis TaxID=979746 RepID=A0A7J5BDW7_9MICO|nr:shikimate dehydrogenase [Gulosibacter chungangensis]KAB1644066.1 shikimate dehydrogenase [Gulosibacter chungangensis]